MRGYQPQAAGYELHRCSSFANAATACGHITIGPTDVQVDADSMRTIGIVYMTAGEYTEALNPTESLMVHIAGDGGVLRTKGSICSPRERV